MNRPPSSTRYNHRIPHMRARSSSSLRLGWLTSLLLATALLPSPLCASSLGDAARQLAHKIAAAAGPGAFALAVSNRSSLDDKSVREVRSALEAELHVEGVHAAKAEQAIGTIEVVLSESLREYVWTAETVIGADEKKVALVALPRPTTGTAFTPALPIVLKATRMFAQESPILDVALVDVRGRISPHRARRRRCLGLSPTGAESGRELHRDFHRTMGTGSFVVDRSFAHFSP